MKKTLSILLSALLVCCTLIPAFAVDPVNVVVTVCAGVDTPSLSCADVTVTDKDADGALTVYDALYCAHEQFFQHGTEGFGTAKTEYGLSMTKLWGNENGFSFGYYVNDVAAWSLTDPVKEGDYVAAFVYTDTQYFSDAYSYFDVKAAKTEAGEAVALTLSKLEWVSEPTDEDPYAGSMQSKPVAGAVILINGEESAFKTDDRGKVSVTFEEAGSYFVSAKAADGIIVPPACIVEVTPGAIATGTDAVDAAVTICDGGEFPALACADVAVTDKDADGALTVYDALYCAHEQYYKDGAEGFGATMTDYGISMTKLWGNVNGYGFGYYVNDAAAWSLTDPIAEGDYISAFVYTDTENYSDAYSYFDVKATQTDAGETIALTLSKLEWVSEPTEEDPYAGSMQSKPVADAAILLDGEATDYKTDAEGKVSVTLKGMGDYVISAKAADGVIVPPACKVTLIKKDVPVTQINAVVTVCAGSDTPSLACEDVTVTDKDADGALTVYDALYCAHEQFSQNGAEDFGAAMTDYGLSMTKLWGNANGYGFGYYVNDAAAWSLTDVIKDGDYVAAFVYTDTEYYSDAYSFFDVKATATDAGEAVSLTLSKVEWVGEPTEEDPYAGSMQNKPVADAVILLNGEETAYKTDAEGKVSVKLDKAGTVIVSAKTANGIIVPPACRVKVTQKNIPGDVDLDGRLTAEDARLALRTSVKLETLSETAFAHADVDKDGAVTPEDARRILRASVHLEELS